MHNEFVPSANADRLEPSSISPSLFVPTDHRIPSPPYPTNASDFAALSPLVFHPRVTQSTVSPPIASSGTTSGALSSSPASFHVEDPIAIENRLYLARLALQYQQIAGRYEICLSQLQGAEREAEDINQHNNRLRRANDGLYRQLRLSSANHNFGNPATNECTPISLLDNHFRRLSLAEPPDEESPTSVFGFQDHRPGRKCCALDDKRLTLPKSISVRSTGYLKLHQTVGSCSESNRNIRHRTTTPVTQQKVCVGGAGKKNGGEAENAVELEVYNQGMFKTELCNKWQESGECPYGDHCQFAHGIGELRPIIRHPRYKTELCRMVLAGDACPYGHRCHFRHSISPQDRIFRPT